MLSRLDQAALAVGSFNHAVAVCLQRDPEQTPDLDLVINDEDSRADRFLGHGAKSRLFGSEA